MAGKQAYTMTEMRDLVNYLVERGAYGEVRGRAMWKDMASSGRTKRTWQSLKEVFLKRILPDVHNPYYRLTAEQVASFRSGQNVIKHNMNKLTLPEAGGSTASDAAKEVTGSVHSGDEHKYRPADGTGELPQMSDAGSRRSLRSSEETVVLDSSDKFADAEDVISSLQAKEVPRSSPSKSLKDMIVYTDPLTPMMQDIIGEWDTDSSRESNEKSKAIEVTEKASGDSYLPGNQEAISLKEVQSQLSHVSDTQASKPPKTRSQANSQNSESLKQGSHNNDSVLKSVLSKKSSKPGPKTTKKNVRLSEEISSENNTKDNSHKVEKMSLVTAEKVSKTKSKKTSKTEKVGDFSTTEDLLSVLTNSILPNNQEGMKAIRKFLEPQPSQILDEQTNSNSQLTEQSEHLHTNNKIKVAGDTTISKNVNKQKTRTDDEEVIDDNKESQATEPPGIKRHTRANNENVENTVVKAMEVNAPITKNNRNSTEIASNELKSIVTLSVPEDKNKSKNSPKTSPIAGKRNSSPLADTGGKDSISKKAKPVLLPAPTILEDSETQEDTTSSKLKEIENNENNTIHQQPTSSLSENNQSSECNGKTADVCNDPKDIVVSEKEVNLSEKEVDISQKQVKTSEKEVNILESNPCLQSVSLYVEAEKFEAEKASQMATESDDVIPQSQPTEKPNDTVNDIEKIDQPFTTSEKNVWARSEPMKATKSNGIVLLHSHSSESDSESVTSPLPRKDRRGRGRGAMQPLPKLFGFAEGNTRAKRSRKRLHTVSRSSESESEWSEEDCIPVPRPGRRHLHMRRPGVGRVQELGDGSLVALCGGRVYSLVSQRGRRLYGHRRAPPADVDGDSAADVDDVIMSPRPRRAAAATAASPEPSVREEGKLAAAAPPPPAAPQSREQTSVVLTRDKITFTGDVERILTVLPKFQQVMAGLEAPAAALEAPAAALEAPAPAHRKSSSVDDVVVSERVKALEEEIFRKIADEDLKRSVPARSEGKEAPEVAREEPVKRKRGRKKKEPQPSGEAVPASGEVAAASGEAAAAADGAGAGRGSSDSEREIILKEEAPTPRRRRRAQHAREGSATRSSSGPEEEMRYALPAAPSPRHLTSKRLKKPSIKRRLADKQDKELDDAISCESTQGYQDSDATPFILSTKRRRRFSHQMELLPRQSLNNSLQRCAPRRSYNGRRKSSLLRIHNMIIHPSSDSESVASSLNCKEKQTQTSPDKMENGAVDAEMSLRLTPEPESVGNSDVTLPGLDDPPRNAKDAANSSNVSLPPSPELSIVEQISVRARSISRSKSRFSMINQQMNDSTLNPRRVSIVLDNLDFTCPLMEQDLAFARELASCRKPIDHDRKSIEEMELCASVEDMAVSEYATENTMKQKDQVTVTDSLISRVTDVNINDTPATESIDTGSTEMQLHSAFGTSREMPSNIPVVRQTLNIQKTGKLSMKRCSTPNKKKRVRKSQPPAVSSLPEEELMHTESCKRRRRKSCPAILNLEHNLAGPLNSQPERTHHVNIPKVIVTADESHTNRVTVRKARKSKTKIIKVKITRPKKPADVSEDRRPTKKKGRESKSRSRSTGSAAQEVSMGSSAELVHNHSDTCLAGAECAGAADSDGSAVSRRHEVTPSPDCFSSDARDSAADCGYSEESTATVAVRLSELGSLLTEDSSPSPSGWYLLSDEENSLHSWREEDCRSWREEDEDELRARYGAHISSLYPLVSAVPHLSTITEASSDTRSCAAAPAAATASADDDDYATCSGSPLLA